MNDKQDLTTGTISKKLIAYALPLLAANLLQSFYSLMDMLVVGRIVEETGLCRNQQRLYAQFYYQLCVYRHYNGRYGISRPV